LEGIEYSDASRALLDCARTIKAKSLKEELNRLLERIRAFENQKTEPDEELLIEYKTVLEAYRRFKAPLPATWAPRASS
jgi:uncharacterized protein (UPF0305 family)